MKRLEAFIFEYLDSLTSRGLSEATKRRESFALARFKRWLGGRDVRAVTAAWLIDYTNYLSQIVSLRNRPLSPRTIELEYSALKGFFEYLYQNDYLLTNPLENFSLVKTENETRKIFSEEEIGRFLDSIPLTRPAGQRDRAFFELAYSSGFRLGELCGLKLDCLYLDDRICFVKQGKGKKDRYVPFSQTSFEFLMKYLEDGRKKQERLVKTLEGKEYVFLGSTGRLRTGSVRRRFSEYLDECGLGNRGFTIHSIRHACATHLLSHGASIRYVQELLGHESLNTTQIYARPGEWDVKKMYRMYHPRENEYYLEPDEEYLEQVKKLAAERQAAREYQNKRSKKL